MTQETEGVPPQPRLDAALAMSAFYEALLGNSQPHDEKMQSIELHLILLALNRTGGIRSKAARLLGMKRTTLVMMCKRYNIPSRLRLERPVK